MSAGDSSFGRTGQAPVPIEARLGVRGDKLRLCRANKDKLIIKALPTGINAEPCKISYYLFQFIALHCNIGVGHWLPKAFSFTISVHRVN